RGMTAEQAAKATLKAIANGTNEVTFTARGKLFVFAGRFFPRLVDWIAARRVRKLYGEAPAE
ncbi:MAG TPA: short-chain dehydrogenase, partial [Gemmataceae bacterium]